MEELRRYVEIVSLQPNYSLLSRDIEQEVAPYCLDDSVGIIGYGTLAGGILTGKFDEIPRLSESSKRCGRSPTSARFRSPTLRSHGQSSSPGSRPQSSEREPRSRERRTRERRNSPPTSSRESSTRSRKRWQPTDHGNPRRKIRTTRSASVDRSQKGFTLKGGPDRCIQAIARRGSVGRDDVRRSPQVVPSHLRCIAREHSDSRVVRTERSGPK